MKMPVHAFDHAYKDYLFELEKINLTDRAQALNLKMKSAGIIIPFFGRQHFISKQGTQIRNSQLQFAKCEGLPRRFWGSPIRAGT